MINAIKGLIKYRDLLLMLTFRDIRIRYKQAAMGFLWAIFMPVVAVFAGILVRQAMLFVSGKSLETHNVVSIAIKVLPWTFFANSIRFSVQSLVSNRDLLTKIYFPRAVLPLSSTLACAFDFSIAAAVIPFVMLFTGIGASVQLLWIPSLLVFLFLFTFGLGLLLSAANLFYRDVKYVVDIILTFGIFFTPVFYEASDLGKWKNLMLYNPLGSILESLHRVVVLKMLPDPFWFSYAGAVSIIMFCVGLSVFYGKEQDFAENV